MAFLHCTHCGWEQDDFWNKGINPLRSLLDWEDTLLDRDLDEKFVPNCDTFNKKYGHFVTVREVLQIELERASSLISRMRYRTFGDWKKDNPTGACPKCGRTKEMSVD